MIIVTVTFKVPAELTADALKDKFMETAPIYIDTPGLIRKNYIANIERNTAGGIYCFNNIKNAKNWFDEKRIEWLTKRYSKPEIVFYENPVIVDNENKKIIS